MATAIRMQNLSFGYQSDSLVLENINWEVKEGEFAAIVGPNGGGKTTLLKMILGSKQPSKGKVEVFGKRPDLILKKIAYVPQNLIFDKQFPINVLEVVLMGRLAHLPWYGRYSVEDKAIAFNALETVRLSHMAKASFGDLSGGQRQRTLIARALASNPDLLLLDEPTASVDLQAEADIYQLLRSFQGKMTIVMVTHDLQSAINSIGQVVLVQKSLRSLSPDEICQHFAIGLYHPPVQQGKLNVIS